MADHGSSGQAPAAPLADLSLSSEPANTPPAEAEDKRKAQLVQYVVLRKDLQKEPFSWPLGSMIAQGCHVVSKLLWELRDEENVQAYFSDIDNMHKITLGAKDEAELRKVAAALDAAGMKYRLWVEQPEGYATALATMPYHRAEISPYLKKLKLLS